MDSDGILAVRSRMMQCATWGGEGRWMEYWPAGHVHSALYELAQFKSGVGGWFWTVYSLLILDILLSPPLAIFMLIVGIHAEIYYYLICKPAAEKFRIKNAFHYIEGLRILQQMEGKR